MTLFDHFRLERPSPGSALKPFECFESDLTGFLYDDSSNYTNELLAVTYIFESENEIAAYFSVSNDKISRDFHNTREGNLRISRGEGKRLQESVPHGKERESYPAVKVGRLAVNLKYEGKGFGSDILGFIKHFFTSGNKTGCRFITVDALNNEKVIRFYKKNGFIFLTKLDAEHDTRLMYFDLAKFTPPVEYQSSSQPVP